MDAHEDNPNGRYAEPSATTRARSGLGITRTGALPRTQSYQALIQDAGPMAGSADLYDNPLADPADPANRTPHEYTWSPPLTGRTLGGFSSPEPSPAIHDDSSAWERVAKRAHFGHIEDRGDLGMGQRGDRDFDTLSVDSLQMHDGMESGARDKFQNDYDTYKKTLAAKPSLPSKPPANVHIRRSSGLAIWLLVMSIYSTIMSAIWLIAAIIQPRWGTTVSSHGSMNASTASMVAAILAKTIEMSFVTVFVAFIGQVLTKKAMTKREGMTLSEMSMRTWVTQPGSLLANLKTLRYAGRTALGMLTLMATIVVIFYTTASDTMVAPKLQFSDWKQYELKSFIKTSYANSQYIEDTCATPITPGLDGLAWNTSCLDVQNAGNSWPDILNFLSTWAYTSNTSQSIAERPRIESMLYDNVTVYGTWIETEFSDAEQSFNKWSRVINNVSLAMPHPGVYTAAINESMNHILQPSDLDGTGSYNVSAGVISPAANVLCVNMSPDELEPLVYTTWPHANTMPTGYSTQLEASYSNWTEDIPVYSSNEWLNSTVVDDIFQWGEKYNRVPPVFELYPADDNFYANNSMLSGSSIYFIAKSRFMTNYTICELRSWPAVQCSTRFDVSGTTGMSMSADCLQNVDYYSQSTSVYKTNPDAYVNYMNLSDPIADSGDWKFFANNWVTSLSLSSGQENGNSSVSRILTECALQTPQYNASLPSMAEGFAALLANTLVTSALDTPFIHYWNYTDSVLPGAGELVSFPARVRNQEYASWHSENWQGVFYPVLAAAFLLNVLCLWYLWRGGLVKDFLEPTSLFAIATSASSAAAAATPGARSMREAAESSSVLGGKSSSSLREKTQLIVPYRLAYREEADHYVFEEAAGGGVNKASVGDVTSSGVEMQEGVGGGSSKRKRYSRLSAKAIH